MGTYQLRFIFGIGLSEASLNVLEISLNIVYERIYAFTTRGTSYLKSRDFYLSWSVFYER